MKNPELAYISFDSARIVIEKEMKKQPDEPRIHLEKYQKLRPGDG
jgi:hypothetical protein